VGRRDDYTLITRESLGPEDWVRAAEAELISGGVNAVKVDSRALAGQLLRALSWHLRRAAALPKAYPQQTERWRTV
jgi:hypothetical protein